MSFRADSAAHKKNIFNLCDKKEINFYISLDMNSVVRKIVQHLYDDGDEWQPVPDNDKQEWFVLTMMTLILWNGLSFIMDAWLPKITTKI